MWDGDTGPAPIIRSQFSLDKARRDRLTTCQLYVLCGGESVKCRDCGGQHALSSFSVAMYCEKDDDHWGKAAVKSFSAQGCMDNTR